MAVFAIFCWGTNAPVNKVLLSELSNMEVLGYSSTIASIVLLLVIFLTGEWRKFQQYHAADYIQLALFLKEPVYATSVAGLVFILG